jgi:hypothetical protein
MKKLVNLRDHCPPESVYRQTRKLLTRLKRPHIRIQPGAIPQLQFLDPSILLHLWKNLLVEKLPFNATSAVPLPKVSIVKDDSDSFKTVIYREKTTTSAPVIVTVKHHWQIVGYIMKLDGSHAACRLHITGITDYVRKSDMCAHTCMHACTHTWVLSPASQAIVWLTN